MGKARVATAARGVRLELGWQPAHLDRASDRRVALCVRGPDPIRVDLGVGRKKVPRARRIARTDVELELGREVAELSEPEPVLVDEVEGQAVAPRRNRATH